MNRFVYSKSEPENGPTWEKKFISFIIEWMNKFSTVFFAFQKMRYVFIDMLNSQSLVDFCHIERKECDSAICINYSSADIGNMYKIGDLDTCRKKSLR